MALRCGIVGLPNVGKSTLFNALSNARAESANYPFCTIEPNLGMVSVPDDRLLRLAGLSNPKKTTPTTIEFVDIAGLVAGASKGEGLGNQFLGHIRQVDAIVHVVRCFDNDNVIHVSGTVDPANDIAIIETELLLKDLDSIEKRIERISKQAKGGDKKIKNELAFYQRLQVHLEAQIAELEEDERAAFLEEMDLEQSGLERLICAAYDLLGLITFFTTGPTETRAWTIRRGTKAPQAAGQIHTDFERGFIRAETIAFTAFDHYGSEAAARDVGVMRSEGKEYTVVDGDVMLFRFNV